MILEIVVLVMIYMILGFFISLMKKDMGIVDMMWGIGFLMIALYTLFRSNTFMPRQIIVSVLVMLWGLRLAAHIHTRNKNKTESFKYSFWRKKWGKYTNTMSFLNVFMLQGMLMIIVAFPIILINSSSGVSLTFVDMIGLGMWILGFLIEAISDQQLLKFKSEKKNANKVLMTGMWKYSRHPNYFGEALQWWGIFFMALPVNGGLVTIISPIIITGLLIHVTGIPYLEKRMSRIKSYAAYKKKTSMLFPMPPKK